MARALTLKLILVAAAASVALAAPGMAQSPDEALTRLDTRIAADPGNPDLLVSRGRLNFLLGNYDQAAADLWNATEARPALRDDASLQIMRGRSVMELGRPGDAVGVFDLVKGRTAMRARAAYWRAEALIRDGRRNEAAASLEEALELDPDYSLAQIRLNELSSAPMTQPAQPESMTEAAETETDPFGLRGDNDPMRTDASEDMADAVPDGPVALQPEAPAADDEMLADETGDGMDDIDPEETVEPDAEPAEPEEALEPEAPKQGPRFVLETGEEVSEDAAEAEAEAEAEADADADADDVEDVPSAVDENENETLELAAGANEIDEAVEAEADAEPEAESLDAGAEAEIEDSADIGIALKDSEESGTAGGAAGAVDSQKVASLMEGLSAAKGPNVAELRFDASEARENGDLETELSYVRGIYLSQQATKDEIERYTALTTLISTKDAVRDFQIARLAESARHTRLAAALYEGVESSGELKGHNLAVARGNLATQQMALGDLNSALAAADRSLEADPDYANAWAVKGLVLHEMGEEDKSVAAMKHAYDLGARAPEVMDRLNAADMEAGN